MNLTSCLQRLKSLSTKSLLLIASSTVVVIATIVALSGTISSASQRMEKKLYGEEIGNNHLRYKYGDHIYDPKTGEVLVDSIDWLHINYSDTIAILAKNNRRAFINLNTAQLITPLIYEKAWEFACDRGIMVKSDTIYIFRRDGSLVNPSGFKYKGQYDLLYHRDKLIVNVDNDKVGLIDTAAQWVLPPVYSMIENEYQHRLYNTRLGDQCIVYDYALDTVLHGAYRSIDVDWSEGLIASEYNGIQHLFSYEGKLIYEVIYKSISELAYNTGRKDAQGNEIWEETNCYVYTDYNGKKGLMDKYIRQNEKCAFYKTKSATKFQKQQTPIAKVCCFF